jgi:hypothetical protein
VGLRPRGIGFGASAKGCSPGKEGVFSGLTAASEKKGGHLFGLGALGKGAQPMMG